MPTLELPDDDARIVALAVRYHLARPGSETDRATLQRRDDGLLSVDAALVPQLGAAVARLDVTSYQLHRIDEGLLGVTNELKAYEMAQRRSAVPRFAETLTALYPSLAPGAASGDDAEAGDDALDLVERVVALRRRLASAVRDAREAMEREREQAAAAAVEARRAQRPWWRFWG
ncbi:MAG: hypothetical protein WC211_02385 [Dehalococcoidia bacterium]